MSREERVSNWRALVEKQTESGMSAAAFCKAQNINPQRFYSWRRRFSCDSQTTEFIRLVPTSRATPTGIRIVLDHQMWIEVERGFDPLTLKEVIHALRTMGG
jgi:transposase-like protein